VQQPKGDDVLSPAPLASATIDSDRDLMLRLRRRDVQALEQLYDRHCQAAMGLAFRITRDRAMAEDVVQDTFLTIWRQPERFDPERGTARGWLLAIVHHRSIDRVRRAASAPTTDLTPDLIDDRAADPAEAAFAAIRYEQISAALALLPKEQREAIELSFLHGRTHAEIADLIGCPLGTVKGRIRIGLARLRQIMTAPDRAAA
jgi:RNA polymerase sigma-70 factor, ECF subfamily